MKLTNYLQKLTTLSPLRSSESYDAFDIILKGEANEAEIAALLMALNMRPLHQEELEGANQVMLSNMKTITALQNSIDIVGTGGDGLNSYNISTAAAIVVAGCDVRVVKHGNRSASSKCGAADVIERLGFRLDADIAKIQTMLNETGWIFLFAPNHHTAMRHVAGVRKNIGIRTIFNLLGPLCNPARPDFMLLGVSSRKYLEIMANLLIKNGIKKAWIVCGDNNIDEVNICGTTYVCAVSGAKKQNFEIKPQQAGLPQHHISEISSGNIDDYHRRLLEVLTGQHSAYRDAVILNSAAALLIVGRADNLKTAAKIAANAIDNGKALQKLEQLVKASRK